MRHVWTVWPRATDLNIFKSNSMRISRPVLPLHSEDYNVSYEFLLHFSNLNKWKFASVVY
jgi:hypothetical protein